MGAVLLQHGQIAWQPLAFFSKKLISAQQKYREYDRELLTNYEAVKNSAICWKRAILPSSQTTSPSPTPSSKRGTNDHRGSTSICILSTNSRDIKHISGQDNVVADALSRVESVTVPLSYDALAAAQDRDEELRTLLCVARLQDCRTWARACQPCQHSKVSRNIVTALGDFTPPEARFLHVHFRHH
jgi:cleavage and polyadenylation specificity factor subunit 1